MMGIVLFKVALVVYLASAVVYGGSLWGRRVMPARFATGLMFAALVIHTFSFISRWLAEGVIPAIGLYDVLSFFAWVMAAAYLAPASVIILAVLIVSVAALAILGALGARAGAAPMVPAVSRVVGWGIFAMAITAAIGWLFGVSV